MHILMNNCYANYGSTNARELAAMIEADLADVDESPAVSAVQPAPPTGAAG
jgi:hypothetical protein